MAMGASPDIIKPPPPPPPLPPPPLPPSHSNDSKPYRGRSASGDDDGLGLVLVLRAAAALLAFVAVALVASCRHGDWMEFTRYQEYRYLLGVAVVASVYSALQALRGFRRMRAGTAYAATFVDFAGDQAVGYLLVTAASAALPITIRMRSAVVNTFTDAIAASISFSFLAFAALAFSAMLTLSASYN
ncbi:CASP-like protein 4B1 [Oryza brachyantha]|uniref:CASP-like protein 4B1 n=1 Tax=Oryza brachyantha TaxID=4533 RepID=UPI001ADC3146|nr:CASP-like protein 4B1 [Oryza brachyantha]